MNSQEMYNDYNVTDFVWNEDFRKWVLSPGREDVRFWQNWLLAHPEKRSVVYAAREMVLALQVKEPALSEAAIEQEVQSLMSGIGREWEPAGGKRIKMVWNKRWQLGVAAAVVLAVLFGAARYVSNGGKSANLYRELVGSQQTDMTEKSNLSAALQTVSLPDGSQVALEKGAKISYASSFNGRPERKVYLSGTAVFEVAKNPSRPFLVYANGLITKVLGTRFIIRSNNRDKKVSVEVLSGIVSVYSYIDNKVTEDTGRKKLNTLILTVNQKANYSSEDKTLTASLVVNPLVVSSQEADLTFRDTPIDTVFGSLERAYGINIVYDPRLAERTFTAAFTTETMYEKMDVICKTLNARYEVIDGKIVVYNVDVSQ